MKPIPLTLRAPEVLSLDSRSAVREDLAGGKGARLAHLLRKGYRVPRGFVITTAAFQEYVAGLRSDQPEGARASAAAELAAWRAKILSGSLPPRLEQAILAAYRRMGGPVAVRSSMVGEDAGESSFAGQLDSILNVDSESGLLAAIRQCWASLFGERLWDYLAASRGPGNGDRRPETGKRGSRGAGEPLCLVMAVIVQRMVAAQAAGVAFSADPTTGQRCIIVEAVRGLADELMQGRVEPDHYVVDARGVLAECRPIMDTPVLSEEQIGQLAQLVRRVAGSALDPQDVEWAWDGSEFHLLQSRPITSLRARTVYSSQMIGEMLPGLVKPLVWSTTTMTKAVDVIGRIFSELTGSDDVDYRTLIRQFHSRIYLNLTLTGQLFGRMGLPANMFDMMQRDERGQGMPPMNPRMLLAATRLVRSGWRYARISRSAYRFVESHDRELDHWRRQDLALLTPAELLASLDRLMESNRATEWYSFICRVNMLIHNAVLRRFLAGHSPPAVANDLVSGLAGLKSLQPNRELRKLGRQARALPADLRDLLASGTDGAIRAALGESEAGRALVASVDAFLSRFGFLSPNGTDFTLSTWIENPSLIWRAIGRLSTNGRGAEGPGTGDRSRETGDGERGGRGAGLRSAESNSRASQEIHASAVEQVRGQLPWRQRWLFDRLLPSTLAFIDLRDHTGQLWAEDAYQLRRLSLALGRQFVRSGDLEQADDVFYLMYGELRQVVSGELPGARARALAAERRAALEADALVELPETICGDEAPVRPVELSDGQDYLVGIAGSGGVVQGYARVIFDPTEAPPSLTQDDILVVPFTDVGWTPLFTGIGGIVAETGGQLSHTSIVAREYGLPAVVSVRRVTRLLRDGQPITLDGDRGRVYLRHLKTSFQSLIPEDAS